MRDEIGAITARISEIQQRISALAPPPALAALPAAPTFEKALAAASVPPAGAVNRDRKSVV